MMFSLSCSRVVVFLALVAATLLHVCHSFPWKGDDGGDHEYEPPQEGQMRSPCPAVNTTANHGFVDRSGKNIELKDLAQALDDIWGVPASVLMVFIISAVTIFGVPTNKTLDSWTMDLDALFTGAEHDASLVSEDKFFAGDQPPFSQDLFDQCFTKDTMTVFDLAACNRARILDSRKNNPTADFPGIVNSAVSSAFEIAFMMLFGDSPLIIDGSKDDFESVLKFNRIPDGYRRRDLPELVPFIIPLSVTVPSGIKALKTPIDKSDSSIPAISPEVPINLISMLKSLVDDYPFEIREYLAPVVEAIVAELEALHSSQ